jgi:hypothetical protein
MNATLTVNSSNSSQVNLTLVVTNNTPNPASNWQVAIALNNSTLNQGSNGGEVNMIGGQAVFSPNQNSPASLGVGASSAPVTFSVSPTSTSNFTPTIATVDGVANGAAGAGVLATGVDPIAQSVATGAMNIAIAYETNKLSNDGDPDYAQYDSFIWDAHSYIISGSTIEFDSNVPGYAFIPNQAKAELAFAQLDASVAAYLVDGLQSCFADSSGAWVYNFRAGVLKGFTANATSTGSLIGVIPPTNTWTPSGYNVNNVVDTYSTSMVKGSDKVTATLKGTQSPASAQDYWFGMLTSTTLNSFSNTSAVLKKYEGSGNNVSCSPFNGPGGGANPSFTITLNNQTVQARFQGVGQQCQNPCSSTLVMDPAAYASPGVQYDSNLNVLGPQINPFALLQNQLNAIVDHETQWAIRTALGVQTWGQFTNPVSIAGTTKYQYVDQGAIPPGTTFDP